MSNGCVAVGSDKIGSVPFLIQNGVNGCIFSSENLKSLEEQVCFVLDNPELRHQMSVAAYRTMKEIWSPQNAARQFLNLIIALQSHESNTIPIGGPCSQV